VVVAGALQLRDQAVAVVDEADFREAGDLVILLVKGMPADAALFSGFGGAHLGQQVVQGINHAAFSPLSSTKVMEKGLQSVDVFYRKAIFDDLKKPAEKGGLF
jgi:hypothetical protein